MSNTFRQLTHEEFSDARRGRDGITSPQRFLVHEFPVEGMRQCYQISVCQNVDGSLVAIDRQILIEPTCLVPIEKRRRYEVELGVRELQKHQAHKRGRVMRSEDMAAIKDLPDFDCRFTSRYEIWVPR